MSECDLTSFLYPVEVLARRENTSVIFKASPKTAGVLLRTTSRKPFLMERQFFLAWCAGGVLGGRGLEVGPSRLFLSFFLFLSM